MHEHHILDPDIEAQARHDQSAFDYPFLNLSKCEYVILNVERSVWAYVRVWLISIGIMIVLGAMAIIFGMTWNQMGHGIIVACGMAFIVFLCGIGAVRVLKKNVMIVTNERVYMHLQTTPFSFRAQNIELENVEDFSYCQSSILETMLDYGSIRLSTFGDEHTYEFHFTDRPAEQYKIINEIVQAVDPRRPVYYKPKNGD